MKALYRPSAEYTTERVRGGNRPHPAEFDLMMARRYTREGIDFWPSIRNWSLPSLKAWVTTPEEIHSGKATEYVNTVTAGGEGRTRSRWHDPPLLNSIHPRVRSALKNVVREVMDRIMSLPRTEEFKDWTPKGYEKPIEELRREMGPELSDDDLLLKILIPGKPVKPSGKKKKSKPAAVSTFAKGTVPSGRPSDFPTEFEVDVDGDLFNVKISPVWDGDGMTERASTAERPEKPKGPKELPSGALLCGMAGLILSIEVELHPFPFQIIICM